ncbi:hypothetical protein BZB76_3784 [Actinomadura pelletieri DSM 43383]|uniref:Uncharacterized protein n=1 Tax=Actinomadura pelletieri DSM 43383 TaxID=1120940 RepID=A0A495QKI9_9ACTN|nr:DUF6223 family protein [Actinomadura pelletieri]RKS73100.1 hypothetical protein BZB76_3784 [Actinomadura pelletieri DSM 43383]
MSVRSLLTTAGAALLGVGVLAAPAAAQVSAADEGPGRGGALLALLVALVGLVLGGLALARAGGAARGMAVAAPVVAVLGMILAGVHLARADGGVGSGSGSGGAVLALVIGLIALVVGGLALARSRRSHRAG